MTPLRQRMIEDLKIRNYSPRTISEYGGPLLLQSSVPSSPPRVLTPGFKLHSIAKRSGSVQLVVSEALGVGSRQQSRVVLAEHFGYNPPALGNFVDLEVDGDDSR